MSKFSTRSNEDEIMDDFALESEILDPVLKELEVINKLLGGFNVFYDAFKKVKLSNGDSVCDWGCGGGDSLKVLNSYFKKQKLQINLIGIDATPSTVNFATKRHQNNANIQFRLADVLKENFNSNEFDVVISSLFTHHFDDEKWVLLIQKMTNAASKAVIINDLHRHWFAYYSIGFLTKILSKSPMVKHDSKVSVLRSFKKSELKNLLQQAGYTNFTIKWMWAFRWQVVIYK